MPSKKKSAGANANKTAAKSEDPIVIPDTFMSTIRDFLADLSATFPEYAHLWTKWLNVTVTEQEIIELFSYISRVYPERFFDILYENDDIFALNSETETRFLPGVDFKILYNCDGVSAKTREAIWKYLQLILMTILKSVKNKVKFGDTANIFDGVDETDLQNKLRETMEGIGEFFKNISPEFDASANATEGFSDGLRAEFEKATKQMFDGFDENSNGAQPDSANTNAGPNMNIPGAEEIHEHLKGKSAV
jgi:hypothetical protein